MREQKRKRRRGLRSDLDRDAITTRERKINKNRFHANSRVSFRNKTATKWMKTYKKKNVWDYLAVGITTEQHDCDVIDDMCANGWILRIDKRVDNWDLPCAQKWGIIDPNDTCHCWEANEE